MSQWVVRKKKNEVAEGREKHRTWFWLLVIFIFHKHPYPFSLLYTWLLCKTQFSCLGKLPSSLQNPFKVLTLFLFHLYTLAFQCNIYSHPTPYSNLAASKHSLSLSHTPSSVTTFILSFVESTWQWSPNLFFFWQYWGLNSEPHTC
jgi:hypothetical protein